MTEEKSPKTKPVEPPSNMPEVLAFHLGESTALQYLVRAGLPLTVKNYVDLNYWGELPDEIDPDEQERLDALAEWEQIQKQAGQ